MVGEIEIYAGTNLSVTGWLPCDGRLMPIASNPTLFSVISNYYECGDGETNFALPDLRGRTPVGSSTGQPGALYGAEQIVLTVENCLRTPISCRCWILTARDHVLWLERRGGWFQR